LAVNIDAYSEFTAIPEAVKLAQSRRDQLIIWPFSAADDHIV